MISFLAALFVAFAFAIVATQLDWGRVLSGKVSLGLVMGCVAVAGAFGAVRLAGRNRYRRPGSPLHADRRPARAGGWRGDYDLGAERERLERLTATRRGEGVLSVTCVDALERFAAEPGRTGVEVAMVNRWLIRASRRDDFEQHLRALADGIALLPPAY